MLIVDPPTEWLLIVTIDYYVSVKALAAANSSEGRQNGGVLEWRCSALAGHQKGVIEHPNVRLFCIQSR